MEAVVMDAQVARARLAEAVRIEIEQLARGGVVWGVNDCALTFANVIRRALGYDPAEGLRGTYDTEEGAHRVVGKMGIAFHCHAVAMKHGWRRIEAKDALPGDVGFARKTLPDQRATVMVCRAPGWFFCPSPRGILNVPHTAVRLVSAVV